MNNIGAMKRLFYYSLTVFLSVFASCMQTPAAAQDDEFPELADHGVAIQQVIKEWHNHGLYTAGWDDNATIRNYIVGLAYAYPNDLFQMIVSKLLGLDVDDAFTEFVLDEKNGYVMAELCTETSPSVQMCYWKCNDGTRLIGVATLGEEYNIDESEPDPSWTDEEMEDNIFVNLNDIAFFRVCTDEMLWRPVAVKDICGKDLNFKQYDRIELPRQGKDIRLVAVDYENDEKETVTTLVWNGSRFTVKK